MSGSGTPQSSTTTTTTTTATTTTTHQHSHLLSWANPLLLPPPPTTTTTPNNDVGGTGSSHDCRCVRVHAHVGQPPLITHNGGSQATTVVVSSEVWVISAAAYAAPPGTVAFADRVSPGMHLDNTVLLIPNYNYRNHRRRSSPRIPISDTTAAAAPPNCSNPITGHTSSVSTNASHHGAYNNGPLAPSDDAVVVNADAATASKDYNRHLSTVGDAVRLTVDTVGDTLHCVGLAAQLALSLSSTCSYLRRVCDADAFWHTLFVSHRDAPVVSISHPAYSDIRCGLWKTLYKVFCARISLRDEHCLARPRNFCTAVVLPEIVPFYDALFEPQVIQEFDVPPHCHFDRPGCVVASHQRNHRVKLLSKGKRFWDISFEYGPLGCHRPPVVRHVRKTGKNLECYLNDAEWVDIHVDGKSYLLHSATKFSADFNFALEYISPGSEIKVVRNINGNKTMNPTVRHIFTGVPTPIKVDTLLVITFLIEYTMEGNSIITQERHLNFQDKELTGKVILPEDPIRSAAIVKVTGPENIEISGVGTRVELSYPIPKLLSPPGKHFTFQVGSNDPLCDKPPKVEARIFKSGEIIRMEPYDHPSTGKWNYIRDLSPALIGTEVEAFAQYGPEKHSLFKCVVPSLTAEHVAIDNHQQVLFSLRLSNWFGRYSVLLNEVDVVLVSSSENVQKVSYLHSLEWWDAVCIVTSVPAGAYSVVISTKDDGEIISQFPVDVVPKEPPPTYTWSRLGTSTCHICHDTIRTGSQWTCKACEYDLCDKCHTEATFTTTKHPQHQQHQQEQQHPHPLIRHRFKTKHTHVCCVCGVVLGVGDHCLLPYHRQQQPQVYCLMCIPPSLDAPSFYLFAASF